MKPEPRQPRPPVDRKEVERKLQQLYVYFQLIDCVTAFERRYSP